VASPARSEHVPSAGLAAHVTLKSALMPGDRKRREGPHKTPHLDIGGLVQHPRVLTKTRRHMCSVSLSRRSSASHIQDTRVACGRAAVRRPRAGGARCVCTSRLCCSSRSRSIFTPALLLFFSGASISNVSDILRRNSRQKGICHEPSPSLLYSPTFFTTFYFSRDN